MPDVALVQSCTVGDCGSAMGASARATMASQRLISANLRISVKNISSHGAVVVHSRMEESLRRSIRWITFAFFTSARALHYASSGNFPHVYRSHSPSADDAVTRSRHSVSIRRRRIWQAGYARRVSTFEGRNGTAFFFFRRGLSHQPFLSF